jgi:hypothetical protein
VSGNPLHILPEPVGQLLKGQTNGDMSLEEKRQEEDYQRLSALFQFYLQLVLQAFTFALGIAGGVSAFVLGWEVHSRRVVSYGLFLPAALCIGMGASFLLAVRSSHKLNDALQTLKSSLRRALAPHATNLTAALRWLGILLVICGAFIVILWFFIASGLYRHKKQNPPYATPGPSASASPSQK